MGDMTAIVECDPLSGARECVCVGGGAASPPSPAPSPSTLPFNPISYYDDTQGTPASLNIFPPYPNLAAVCYALSGNAQMFTWNPTLGKWL